MHVCPFCGELCLCDLDDTWLPVPANCNHDCGSDDDFIDDDDPLEDDPENSYLMDLEMKEIGRIINDCTG